MRLSCAIICAAVPAMLIGGCSTGYRSPTAEAFAEYEKSQQISSDSSFAAGNSSLTRSTRYASLGAGDRLGRQIYINDVMLAASQRTRDLEYAMPAVNQPITTVNVPVNPD